ncbi:PAS domain-containing protein [Bradyrhizobium sp. STM 3809]|uniref:PAS domain-containing protein n=1 Tax=Bradyrhizobium sp. STM 3809 TaxID=551936 RepID=UPI0002408813|nr:PAS domain-containing protein [Bradyrhizobium sp. STM 3809]CCD99950.1 putative sensor histidine kinase with multiple PAS domains [Bradyrhizobium sp. STM 3809]
MSSREFGRTFWRNQTAVDYALPDLAAGGLDDHNFRLLADGIPTLCWIANGDGYIVWYNRRWHEYCGSTPAQMEGWGWQSVHDPAQLPSVMQRWQASIATGEPFEMTFPLRGADGVFRPFLTRIQPMRDASGRVRRWFGVNTEVSAQVQAEQALRDSEMQARADAERVQLALAAGAIIGTWVWDIPANRFTIDDNFAVNFGLDPALGREGLSLEQVTMTVHPDDQAGLAAAIQDALARGGDYAHQYRVRRRDGRYHWIEANGRVELRDGKPVRFPGVLLDVNARHAAEAALRETEERLRLATQVAEIGFWDYDPATDVLIWPPLVREMFGVAEDVPVTIADFYEGLHPDDREPTTAAFAAAADPVRRALYDVEYRTIGRNDGALRWVAAKGRGLFDDAGHCVRLIGTAIDITARKTAEARLRDLNERLEVANEEIKRYAHVVSHDLRAPLVNIMGFAQELQSQRDEMFAAGELPKTDPLRVQAERDFDESLSFIRAATQKMDGLITAILKVSRHGQQPLHPEPLDMEALVRKLADAIRHQTETAGAVVTIEPLPPLVADPLAVGQIFGNLLDNAVKYLEPGRPGRITVSGEARGREVVVHVADNGRGIRPEDQARVFELFQRAGTRDQPGEGIGLAHVKSLVGRMHGNISLISEAGVGTTFTVTLPRTPAN